MQQSGVSHSGYWIEGLVAAEDSQPASHKLFRNQQLKQLHDTPICTHTFSGLIIKVPETYYKQLSWPVHIYLVG